MGTISRLTASLGTAAIASVLFAPASLAASPTPSPALDTVLVAPTGSYMEEPSGQNDGPMSAADYAARNGAELVSCTCDAGAREATVEVRVAVGRLLLFGDDRSVTARARAEVDLPA